MKKLYLVALLSTALAAAAGAQTPSWEGIHREPAATLQQNFDRPPGDFASHVIWGWGGPMTVETMRHDLDAMQAKGFRAVIIEAGYDLPWEYLSDGWFEAIRTAVLEAKARGMKVWIIDEGKYPSGFAGGLFTRERPELRMKALVAADTLRVAAGSALADHPIAEGILSAVAVSVGQPNRTVPIEGGKISFNAGIHDWDILLVGGDFRTVPTRAVNEGGAKTTRNSVMDYLDPAATRQFLDWTHERYKQYLGEEFGTTVLGFRGDEPDYGHVPWTPTLVDTFIQKKGYDPTPWLAAMLAPTLTETEKRVKADWWDVWSEQFALHFFKQQADWCAANGLAHITHLNNEHNMPVNVRAEGDLFRDLSAVQIPGVDAIWNQIWPGTVNDFPKLASSVAHVYGRPRSFSESFAAYNIKPNIEQAKWVVDHQIVRGINFFEFMFWPAGSDRPGWMSDPGMKNLNEYTNRATYLTSMGEPGARVAMYYPISTMWLGNNAVYDDLVEITGQLLRHQVDFDYVGDDAFTDGALSVGAGTLAGASGQAYSTLVVPSADAISEAAWARIEEFVAGGGKLLFWGHRPGRLTGRTFTEYTPFPDVADCFAEPSLAWTPTVAAAMPAPELRIRRPQAPRRAAGEPAVVPAEDYIRYTRRVLPDADLYFLFNEGDEGCTFTAEFDAVGTVREWNARTGEVREIPFTVEGDKTVLTFDMTAWESRIVTIEKSAARYDITDFGARGNGRTVNTAAIQRAIDTAHAAGGGRVVVPAGTFRSGALFFRPGVDLEIVRGGVLKATVDPADFPVVSTRFEGVERDWRCAFLNFDRSRNVRVFGEGTVDGSGVEWTAGVPFGPAGRPRLICFTACDGGSIAGLRLREQASWCVHVLYTRGFELADLDIRSAHNIPSSDGLDIDSSSEVTARRVFIDVNDDCVSIKSGKDADGRRVGRPSENILIEDCHFAYGHGGVAMGSEISGAIRNVTVRNCRMDGDNWGPIRFKSQPSRGGIVEDITFENIVLNDTRSMIDCNMEWRMVGRLAPPADPLTRLRNIRLINVTGTVESVGTIHGFAEAPFGPDVFRFENCTITARSGLSVANAEVSTEGLTLRVAEGEPVFERRAAR